MKMSYLTDKEKQKFNMILKVITGECSKKDASELLGITTRQINCLLIKYKEEGENSFVHKNRGKISNKRISDNIKSVIVNLYIMEYFDYNFTHFYEELKGKYNFSYKSIVNILTENDIIFPESQRKTIKLYNANIKKANGIPKKEANEYLNYRK